MGMLSTGEHLVWVVFDNDGCECSNFVGIYATQEAAEEVAEKLREKDIADHHKRGFEYYGSIVVEQKTVGITNYYKLENL